MPFIKVPGATVTATELGYLEGVTSNIQTQIATATSTAGVPTVVEVSQGTTQTVTAAYSNATGAGMVAVSGLSVTFTANTNERCLLMFTGVAILTALSTDVYVGYIINGGTPVEMVTGYTATGGGEVNVSFHRWLPALSSGSTTIEICASSSSATDPTLRGTESSAHGHRLEMQVLRFI